MIVFGTSFFQFTRYNPSLKQNIASTYRPWFIVGGILCFIIGISIIAISAVMYATDNDIKNEMFHLWIGIPVSFKDRVQISLLILSEFKQIY